MNTEETARAFVLHPALTDLMRWPACDHGTHPSKCEELDCRYRECWRLWMAAREGYGAPITDSGYTRSLGQMLIRSEAWPDIMDAVNRASRRRVWVVPVWVVVLVVILLLAVVLDVIR